MLVICVFDAIICAIMFKIAFDPFARFPMVHIPVAELYVPLPFDDMNFNPAGNLSTTVIPAAVSGP